MRITSTGTDDGQTLPFAATASSDTAQVNPFLPGKLGAVRGMFSLVSRWFSDSAGPRCGAILPAARTSKFLANRATFVAPGSASSSLGPAGESSLNCLDQEYYTCDIPKHKQFKLNFRFIIKALYVERDIAVRNLNTFTSKEEGVVELQGPCKRGTST